MRTRGNVLVMAAIADRTRRPAALALAAFVAAVAIVAALGGLITETGMGSWYDRVAKPAWQPPSWVFGPVWTTLYLAIAVAGWLWWRERPAGETVVRWWTLQLALNLAWTAAFFGLERPGWALATIVALDVVIAICILVGWEIRRAGSILFLPNLAWTSFATALNLAIVRLN